MDGVESILVAESEAQEEQYPSEFHAVNQVEVGRVDSVELAYRDGEFGGHDAVVDSDVCVVLGFVCSCGEFFESEEEASVHLVERVGSDIIDRLGELGAVSVEDSVAFDEVMPELWSVWRGILFRLLKSCVHLNRLRWSVLEIHINSCIFVKNNC